MMQHLPAVPMEIGMYERLGPLRGVTSRCQIEHWDAVPSRSCAWLHRKRRLVVLCHKSDP